jgi:acetyl-CoA carboxylase carboxyl transferase beta subunit/acetyl-CoA carboxylase carboxyl transferase alpha subunit
MERLFGHRHQGNDAHLGADPDGVDPSCESCGAPLANDDLYARFRVCSRCNKHYPISALERIASLTDPGTFKETLSGLFPTDPLGFVDRMPYSQRLEDARRKTGLADAIVTGTCRIEGQNAVIAAMDFEFLGGSMGSVVGEKVAAACELAIRKRYPLVAVTCSGGARMQEGMLALAQMAKTSAAVARLHSKGMPFIVLFAHPTTGGVYASFGTLGDVLLAEPGALISFAGPRVARALASEGGEAPRTAEFLLEHGQIDAVVPRPESKTVVGELLRLAGSGHLKMLGHGSLPPATHHVTAAWAAVERARHCDRPTSLDYIHRMTSSFVEIHGDRAVGDDPAVICGVADLDGQAAMIVALERGHCEDDSDRRGGHARPQGYRKAQRAMRLAEKWRLPLLTLIDTPGADPGVESEAGGLGGTISHTMALMSQLATPVLAVVIGEGGSGGALALGVADRMLMMENAIFSVIAPEGAAAILYRDARQAAEVAAALKLTSSDLFELGLVDSIVPEPDGGAHVDHDRAALLLRRAIREELAVLSAEPIRRLVQRRYERWRHVGKTTTAMAATAGRLEKQLETGIKEGAHRLGAFGRKLPGPFTGPRGE